MIAAISNDEHPRVGVAVELVDDDADQDGDEDARDL